MSSASQDDSEAAGSNRLYLWVRAAITVAVSGAWLFSLYVLPQRIAVMSIILAAAAGGIAWIDLREMRIPNALSLPAIPLGIIAASPLIQPTAQPLSWIEHIAAASIGYASLWALRRGYRQWRGHEGLGGGDVKLAAAAGAWVGIEALPEVLLLATGFSLLGVGFIRLRYGNGSMNSQSAIPFGASLAPAIWLIWATTVVDHALFRT